MMFYCPPCQKKNQWPESMARSRGWCEACGRTADCYDTPSKYLPVPSDQSESRGEIMGFTKGDRVRYTVMYGDGKGSGMAHIVHRPHYGRITSLSEHPRRGTVARIAAEDPKPGSAKYVERAVKDIVRIPSDPGAHYLIEWSTEVSEQYEAVFTADDLAECDISDPLAEDLSDHAEDLLPGLEDHGNPEVTAYASTDERYITRVHKLTADELAKRQASVARRTASTAAPAPGRTYSLAEIRDGTGFPPGTRFAIVPAS